MSDTELSVVKKLRSLGAAADGYNPGGISLPVLDGYVPEDKYSKVKQAVQSLVNNGPVERCAHGNYRLESMKAGKAFECQHRPLIYWLET